MRLCSQAFTPRKFQGLPLFRHLSTFRHTSKYETTPLRKALQESLGDGPLFGSHGKHSSALSAKVAVTATDVSGSKAIVIANYSRKSESLNKDRKLRYTFLRPLQPDLELKVWEAAAATSAAPSFFKPFTHNMTEATYYDGALYHNNPVRLVRSEARLLWPDVAHQHPDLLLSLGTGQKGGELEACNSGDAQW